MVPGEFRKNSYYAAVHYVTLLYLLIASCIIYCSYIQGVAGKWVVKSVLLSKTYRGVHHGYCLTRQTFDDSIGISDITVREGDVLITL